MPRKDARASLSDLRSSDDCFARGFVSQCCTSWPYSNRAQTLPPVVNQTPTKIEAKAQDGSASSVQPHSAVPKPKKSLQKYILAVVAEVVLIAGVAS
jgi:hypothetical protein